MLKNCVLFILCLFLLASCTAGNNRNTPSFRLILAEKVRFNSFVDCNMAEAWIGDTFRIFPGKYGEDPLWGDARDLKFTDGVNAPDAFDNDSSQFTSPLMPPNVPPGQEGLHGAVWFETIYQDRNDKSGRTLYAIYHNENYPSTLPYDSVTGEGYRNENWPQGLLGPESPAAVCRIGIMKSTDGGRSWENKGIFIEDLDPRLILKPHNTSNTFAGGVGDPSAVASGDYLYLFYGEYGYPGEYNEENYSAELEWSGQCISVARIALSDLDNPQGKAKRWDGSDFTVPYNGIGKPVKSLQIPFGEGGGAASSPGGGFHWGPSVSWNQHLNCWVMLMGHVTGSSWRGSKIFISFNTNSDFSDPQSTQEWSSPQLLLDKPGYTLWYPSLQPLDTEEDIRNKTTCLNLGRRARLYVKMLNPKGDEYVSEYIVEFSGKRLR